MAHAGHRQDLRSHRSQTRRPRRRLIAEHVEVLQILSDIDEHGINPLAWSEEVRFNTHPQWESDEENNAMLPDGGILVSKPREVEGLRVESRGVDK